MLDHRMRLVAAELANNAQQDRPRLRPGAGELDLALAGVGLDLVEVLEKVDVPGDAPIFAIGHGFKTDRLLLADHAFNLAILDRVERIGGHLAAHAQLAGRFQPGGAQQTADVIGAKRW